MLVSGKKRCLITSRAWVIGINCEIEPNHDGKIDVGKRLLLKPSLTIDLLLKEDCLS